MSPDRYKAFSEQHLPMTVVARDSRRVIVEKPLPAEAGAASQGAAPAAASEPQPQQ